MLAVVGKVLPLKLMSCGIGGDVADAQVHAQGIVGVLGRRCFLFYLNVKVVPILASFLERGTGRTLTRQPLALEVAQRQREDATPINQAQADGLARHVQFEYAGVVVDAGRLEPAVPRLGIGQARSNASNGTDGQVSRQAKAFTDVAIAALMQIILAMFLVLVAPIGHKVAGLGKCLKRRVDTSRYRWRNHQLARKGTDRFHILKYND